MRQARFLPLVVASVLFFSTAIGAESKPRTFAKKYEFIQVNRFDVAQGIDFPAEYQLTIVEDLRKNLEQVKGLKQVLREGEALPTGDPVLMITGTITKYNKGNRATRYLVGFGAGSTVIGAHLKCYDAATKELLLERDVDGKVIIGFMGGKSAGANDGLAREVVKDLKQKFF